MKDAENLNEVYFYDFLNFPFLIKEDLQPLLALS